MSAAHDHRARRDRLRPALADAGIGRLLVTGAANVRYLSGFSGSSGQVIIGADATDDRLITDARYTARAGVEAPGIDVTISRDAIGVTLADAADGNHDLGVEAEHLSWAQAQRLLERAADAERRIEPTRGMVEALRTVKDDVEVARLERACAITADALAWLVTEAVTVGVTERQLATALERRFVDLGADGVAFPSIVASGPNGAVPHHAPTDRPLVAGELLTIDCGAVVDGYHADITRTVAVGAAGGGGANVEDGGLDGQLRELHDVVLRAQAAGIAAAVAGARAEDVDLAAREVVADAGYGQWFVHGTGHGVGLEVHEAPAVARGGSATLWAGVVHTVEPGIYLPGTGGVRIEDTVVVVADGPARPLTDLSRQLQLSGG